MGPHPSDLYQLEDISSLCHCLGDKPPVKYVWVDLNINAENNQNKQHAIIFKDNHLEIVEASSISKFQREVQRWSANLYRLRVICAASLPEETYKYIQQSEKIDRAMLFCNSRVRAEMLMRSYPKIKTACFGSWEVVRVTRLWQKEEETCFFLFDQESIELINRFYSNVLSLTDSANILLIKAKQQFEQYAFKCLSCQRRTLEKIIEQFQRCRTSRQLMIVFLEKYFLGSPLLVQSFNQMLRSTFNPKKLAYLRYIINDTFHAIKDSFPILPQPPITHYYALIEVSEAQLKKISLGRQKYIMFTQFIVAASEPTERALIFNQIELTIKISPKIIGRFSNGYLQSQNKIVFNLGTYFKVLQYDPSNKSLELSVLQLPDNLNLAPENEEHQIYLNRLYQEGQHVKLEGQWHSLLRNQAQQAASDYINEKISFYSRREDGQSKILEYRMSIAANKLKANQTEDYQSLVNELERQGISQSYISCICMGCEHFFDKEKSQKFENAFKKIQRLKDSISKEELRSTFNLLSIALAMTQSGNAESTSSKLRQLQQLERSFKTNSNHLCSELYHYLLRVQLRGYIKLNQTTKSLEVISKLLQIYTICEGKASIEFVQLTHLKDNILATRNGQISQEEMRRKRRLYHSTVNMNLLRKQIYLIEIGEFDLNIYQ